MLSTAAVGLIATVLAPVPLPRQPFFTRTTDSVAILGTVTAFHAALAAGDSAAALALLAPDAVILEAGELETRAQYAAHHLGADIELSRAVPSRRVTSQVHQHDAIAWVASTSTTQGTFRDRSVASQGAELMVLGRTDHGWLIRAIHWSSRRM